MMIWEETIELWHSSIVSQMFLSCNNRSTLPSERNCFTGGEYTTDASRPWIWPFFNGHGAESVFHNNFDLWYFFKEKMVLCLKKGCKEQVVLFHLFVVCFWTSWVMFLTACFLLPLWLSVSPVKPTFCWRWGGREHGQMILWRCPLPKACWDTLVLLLMQVKRSVRGVEKWKDLTDLAVNAARSVAMSKKCLLNLQNLQLAKNTAQLNQF